MSKKNETEEKEKDDIEVLDLELERIPLKLKEPKSGEIEEVYLEELDGTYRDKYLDAQKDKTDFSRKTLKNFKDVHSLLVSYSLYRASTDEKIPIETIRKYPAKVLQKLFEKCVKLNGLNEQAEEQAKND